MKLLNSQDVKPSEIINLSESSNTNKMVFITFLVSACSGDPWDFGGSICGFYEVTFEMWIDEGGGGGGGTGNSGGTEGGGGSGVGGGGSSSCSTSGSNEFPILTTPVHGIQPVNHIARLNEITAIPDTAKPQNVFRNKIFQYIFGLDNATNENGVEYRRGPTTNGVPSYYPVNPIATGYDYTAFGNPALNTVLYIHFHHNHSQTNATGSETLLSPIFSDGDFLQFAKSYTQLTDLNSPERKNFTSIMVSKNGLYAMRVGDAEQLLAFKDWLSDPINKNSFINRFKKNVIEKAKTKAAEIFNSQGGGTQAQLDAITAQQFEKWFIRFIQNFNEDTGNMGIYFFKGTIHQGQVTWTQIAN